jgi:uncharacterized protein YndB with AHSA1/START domain
MTSSQANPNAVVIERILDAPCDLVWRMWTDPAHFSAWYGPQGATIPLATMDVRVGGPRRVCMEIHTPNGPMRMWFTGEYREVIENKRLVYTESMSDENGNIVSPTDLGMSAEHPTITEITVDLDDLGGRTAMVMTHTGIPADSPSAAGWNVALDKLADYVATQCRP